MGWVAPGLLAILFISLLIWRIDRTRATTYGSAGWASVWTIFNAGLFKARGIRVGDLTGRLSVFYEDIHAITFGHSGSGKGVSAILPNLLSYNWFFIVDPGGENTAIAAKSFRQRGLKFGCINIFGMFTDDPWALPIHGFNPLDFLDVNSPTFAADALVFAEMLTPRAGNESGSSSYFKDAAQTAKRALLIHIKTAEPPARRNLSTLYAYVNSDAAGWEALLAAMKASTICGGLVAQEAIKLERVEAQASEEFSAIMSTIQQDLSWLADPLVRDGMSRSDVDFSILKGMEPNQKGGIISVILPLEYIESHAAITRLAMACAVLEMQRTPLAKNKVIFLIDEAASLGKILRFPGWLATMRKYRVVIWSIWQNIGQLVHLYDRNWQTLISNCGLLQILGVGDLETAEYTEKLLGQCTVHTTSTNGRGEKSISETARSLFKADELRRLDDREQIVFIGNLPPIGLYKTPYWKRRSLQGLFYPNPYLGGGRTSQANAGDQLLGVWGRFYYALVWLMAPHPLAACMFVAAAGYFIVPVFWGGG